MAIAASLLTSIFILQSGALVGVTRYSYTFLRMSHAKNFMLNTRRVREEKKERTEFKLEKKEEDPETILRYEFAPVAHKLLKDYKNLYLEKVSITHEAKQKEPDSVLWTLIYVPEAPQ